MDCHYTLIEIFPNHESPDSSVRFKQFNVLNDDFLDTGRYISEYVDVDGYIENSDDEHPLPEILNDELIHITLDYITHMGLMDKLPLEPSWIVDETELEQIISLRNVLGEQLMYMERDPDESDDLSRRFCCRVTCGTEILGEVYAFQNPQDHPEWMVIQGISHSFAAGLAMIFFPQLRSFIPRLNSIVQIGLEDLAKRLHVHDILVYPLSYQGKILQQHYGYVPTDVLFYPSPYILGGPKNPTDLPPMLRLFKIIE